MVKRSRKKGNVIFFDNKPSSKDPWTKEIWFYDYRTNIHHTLKKNPLKLSDLQEFIDCYKPGNRHKRTETWSDGLDPLGIPSASPSGINGSNPIRISNEEGGGNLLMKRSLPVIKHL